MRAPKPTIRIPRKRLTDFVSLHYVFDPAISMDVPQAELFRLVWIRPVSLSGT
jgi:hypothetical protein